MSILSTTILAFSMSADSFAAAISRGIKIRKPNLPQALRIGAVFGIVEAITPVIGWLLGMAANSFITAVDHWIAFIILSIVGGKMLMESLSAPEEDANPKGGLPMLILTAIGTSIDAMAVGVTLAFIDVNIWLSALAIGFATFLMATLGIMTGHYIGHRAGKWAEAIGGLGLIFIGTWILLEHLGYLA
jgi:putative Mn2+ efflux pump MntP